MADLEHILIVDGDDDIRNVLRLILDDLGYRVSLAEDGAAARPMLDRLDVDLLVADEIRVGERGSQLAAYAGSLGVPTLLMSAYHQTKEALEGGNQHFLGKPFRLERLRDEVKRVLARPTRGAPRL
jgi:DNA-binding NtrC family response regulator